MKESKLQKYHNRANVIRQESHDQDTQVAALLISKASGAVIADGFNGFVRGAPDDKLPRSGDAKREFMIHAESNMICNAVSHGISTARCTVYCTLSPCVGCLRLLYQANIKDIYFKDKYRDIDQSFGMGDISVSIESIGEFFHIKLSGGKG